MKKELNKLVGDDHVYYDCLKLAMVSHADELYEENYVKVYQLMATAYKQIKGENTQKEVEAFALKVGPYAFKTTMENHGLKNIEDVLAIKEPGALETFLQEIRSTA